MGTLKSASRPPQWARNSAGVASPRSTTAAWTSSPTGPAAAVDGGPLGRDVLAGVRGDALAKLPEAEREAWKKLWEQVDGLLTKVGAPEKRQ